MLTRAARYLNCSLLELVPALRPHWRVLAAMARIAEIAEERAAHEVAVTRRRQAERRRRLG